jgi:VanZ family protein
VLIDRVRDAAPRLAFGVVVLVSLVVLFLPASGVPTAPPGTDKVVHLLLFAALALTGSWAAFPRVPLALALVGYAAVSEVVQGATPLARSASALDWLADVAGVVLGLLTWFALTRRTR